MSAAAVGLVGFVAGFLAGCALPVVVLLGVAARGSLGSGEGPAPPERRTPRSVGADAGGEKAHEATRERVEGSASAIARRVPRLTEEVSR